MARRGERAPARYDLIFPEPVGRIVRPTGLAPSERAVYDERRQLLYDLYWRHGQVRVLEAFRDGLLEMADLIEAERAGRLTARNLLTRALLRRKLWETAPDGAAVGLFATTIARLGCSARTQQRYAQSIAELHRVLGGSERWRLGHLRRLAWGKLWSRWPGGAADWSNLRIALGSILSTALGSKRHPYRERVMRRVPRVKVEERAVEVSPMQFLRLLELAPAHVRPAYMTMVLTGFRPEEYLALGRRHLREDVHAVAVPQTTRTTRGHGKTGSADALVYIDPELWPWIDAGVPSPLRHRWLLIHLQRAAGKAGIADLHLNDLRHLSGLFAISGGQDISRVRDHLRHVSITTTQRYLRQRGRREVGVAIGKTIRGALPEPTAEGGADAPAGANKGRKRP